MTNAGYPASLLEMNDVRATAEMLGLAVVGAEIRRTEDIAPAFEAIKNRVDALYITSWPIHSSVPTKLA
jgi:ABC-type uncharacterized transport system substrate-binding protein